MNDLHQVRQQAFHGESSLRNVVVSCLKHEGVSILVIKPLKKLVFLKYVQNCVK